MCHFPNGDNYRNVRAFTSFKRIQQVEGASYDNTMYFYTKLASPAVYIRAQFDSKVAKQLINYSNALATESAEYVPRIESDVEQQRDSADNEMSTKNDYQKILRLMQTREKYGVRFRPAD